MNPTKIITLIALAVFAICSFGCATTKVKYHGERDFTTGECLYVDTIFQECANWVVTDVWLVPGTVEGKHVWMITLSTDDGSKQGSGWLTGAEEIARVLATVMHGGDPKANTDPTKLIGVRVYSAAPNAEEVWNRLVADMRVIAHTLIRVEADTLAESHPDPN